MIILTLGMLSETDITSTEYNDEKECIKSRVGIYMEML